MHWQIQVKKEELTSFSKEFHPVVEAILDARGYTDIHARALFLSPDYERDIHDPFLFRNMEQVVERIRKAQEHKEVVGIFGDFDADGVTSSALLRLTLDELGIKNVVYLPDKVTEGHGLSTQAVDFFAKENANVIFTLDCGMMNHEEIAYAAQKGIDVIIVDHHHVPETLPKALVIINPKLKNETYPFRELCGAGTTFKVIQALTARLQPEKLEQLKWLLDIVAIGTVADVMPLIGENRVLVKYGLLVLSKTKNFGLQALLQVARAQFSHGTLPDAEFIAFQLAPRINAASRMAHARIAHDLLVAKTYEEAFALAQELQKLNTERQKKSGALTQEITEYFQSTKPEASFWLAAAPHYAYGIVGLVAGRIAHTYQKPTAILTQGESTSRGSFRSVPGFSVIEALEKCSHLLYKYGGHEQAAGMHIANENLVPFEEQFSLLVEQWQKKKPSNYAEKTLLIDIEILPAHISNTLLAEFKKLAPFGEGNREPILALRGVVAKKFRTIGKNNEHVKLTLAFGGSEIDAIGFQLAQSVSDIWDNTLVDIAFTLGENLWNNHSRLQLKLLDIQKSLG